jgi:hypothetical protein
VAGGCSTAARRFGWSAFRGGDGAVEFGGVDGASSMPIEAKDAFDLDGGCRFG